MLPTIRDRKITKVFSTPWIRARVTMSPLDTWLISWPSTPSTSSGRMLRRRPVETATSAASFFAPVANAFGWGWSKMPTSGMPMFEARARLETVLTSQRSVSFWGSAITWTRMERLATHFDIRSETNEPPMPKMAAKISREPYCAGSPTPSTRRTIDTTSNTAMLVRAKRAMRFIRQTICARRAVSRVAVAALQLRERREELLADLPEDLLHRLHGVDPAADLPRQRDRRL